MKMIPPMMYHTDSKAEQIIFNHLKQSFVNKDQYVAMHSVKLCHHSKKRFTEIDFLLCTNDGLFVLEIKGGQVSCQNGIWYYQDKMGHVNTGGSPFHQADAAMQALRRSLLEKFGKTWVSRICFGYGVILTDSRLPNDVIDTLEYQKPILCHGGEYQFLQNWLLGLFDYWQERNKAIMPMVGMISDEMLCDIIQYIRPNFMAIDDILDDTNFDNIISNNIDGDINTVNEKDDTYKIKINTALEIINNQSSSHISNISINEFLKQCLTKFYEKRVDKDYILAKDITIITDDKQKYDEIKEMIKNEGRLVKTSDGYSFKRRQANELTLMMIQDLAVIHNKILIAIIEKSSPQNWQKLIEQKAKHTAQVFYY